jgi:uncharacterized sodium:solute symporter family permease YidK
MYMYMYMYIYIYMYMYMYMYIYVLSTCCSHEVVVMMIIDHIQNYRSFFEPDSSSLGP